MNEDLHLSRQFDDELERLRTSVLQMGGLIETQIGTAAEAYAENDSAAAQSVFENDHVVNDLEKSIDDDCIRIIAKRQPTASDLRLIMSVSKIVTDLERTGDEAKKIAKSVRRIQGHGQQVPAATADIRHIAKVAAILLRRALDTFAHLDTREAAAVIRADDELDREFKSIVRQLITYMMEDPRTISASLDIITIARAIERIGDHAKNIAEQVIYIVEGRDVRHTKEDRDS